MGSNPVQMIEVRSLQHNASGYRMAVSISQDSAYTDRSVELDEYTYNEILAIYPHNKGRVRLSLYTKWDPYRKLHYSHISYKEGEMRSSLHFFCTTAYIEELQRLKEIIHSPADKAEVLIPEVVELRAKLTDTSSTLIGKHKRLITVRLAVIILFLIIGLISTTDRPFNEEDDPLSVNAASSLHAVIDPMENHNNLIPQTNTVVSLTNQEVLSHPISLSTVQAAVKEEERLVEKVELTGDKATYALPKGYVALTFDDGPSAYTKEIVDILKKQNVAATFLFIGKNTQKYPEAVTYASKQLMSVGNHSWNHVDLERLEREAKLENVGLATKAIENLTKQTNTIFRPPYGSISATTVEDLNKKNIKVLMWNRDPQDWKAESSDAIINYFHKINPSGGIYVLHEKKKTVKALPAIIKYLKEQDLKFVIFE